MRVDKDLFDLYQRQIRNACYEVETAKTLKDANAAAKKADDAAVLMLHVAVMKEAADDE